MKILLALPLAFVACGPPPCPDHEGAVACLDGMTVAVDESEFPLAFPGRTVPDLQRMLAGARTIWGEAPTSGYTVVVKGGWFVCNTGAGPVWTSGCTERYDLQVQIAHGQKRSCDVSTFLHEYGHISGVDDHSDPRYARAEAMKDDLCPLLP